MLKDQTFTLSKIITKTVYKYTLLFKETS